MISKEMQKLNDQRADKITTKIEEMYPYVNVNNELYLYNEAADTYFGIWHLLDDGAIVIESCIGIEEARHRDLEDGDLFYFDEMTDDEIVEAIIREINDV